MSKLSDAAEKGVGWIEHYRDEFSPRRGRDPYEQTMLLKPCAELMLTVTLLGRDLSLRRRLRPIISWAWNEIDRGSLIIDLTSAKVELVEAVGLCADFAQNGYRNDRLRAWLAHLVATRVIQGLELTPWRYVAFRYNLQRLGLGGSPSLPTGSWLGARPEPWTISVTSAYPLTHEVFYLTDFGRSPLNLAADLRDYLQLWLPAWQQCFQEPENLDVLAELAMTAACVRTDPEQATLQLLEERQFDNGSIPGPPGAGRVLPSPREDPERRRFLTHYHATLVGVLALAYRQWSTACESEPPSAAKRLNL